MNHVAGRRHIDTGAGGGNDRIAFDVCPSPDAVNVDWPLVRIHDRVLPDVEIGLLVRRFPHGKYHDAQTGGAALGLHIDLVECDPQVSRDVRRIPETRPRGYNRGSGDKNSGTAAAIRVESLDAVIRNSQTGNRRHGDGNAFRTNKVYALYRDGRAGGVYVERNRSRHNSSQLPLIV